jgi:hypothetical protein
LEDFKETGDETFAWESFEKKLSAYSFLKYLVQENDIHVDLPGLNMFCQLNLQNFLYKSGNNKALLDKKSLTTNSKTG